MKDDKRLRLAAIGCGGRTRTYLGLAACHPARYSVVAAADPDPVRVKQIAELSGNPRFRAFRDDREILEQPQLADVMVIGTQDAQHAQHAIAAMERGYHLLLEKPIAPYARDVERIHAAAVRLKRRVTVCHVLRYTPFYRSLKQMVADGCIGDLVTLNAVEGVGPWHQAHSFVRGHWADTGKSSPMLLAKSCHDLDIIRWLADAPCVAIGSFGRNSWFHAGNQPEGAPARCFDGCPVGENCIYNARRYLDDQQRWLGYVMSGCDEATPDERAEWLRGSPWSRCVYQCENDTVDHQTVNMEFANGVTATFTMTAFESGRRIQLYGTRGRLRGGESLHRDTGKWFVLEPHDRPAEYLDIEIPDGGYGGHLGGDAGLVDALHDEMTGPEEAMTSPLDVSVESHCMAFAAEESRQSGIRVRLGDNGVGPA
jgi:predicted dehydrogenase